MASEPETSDETLMLRYIDGDRGAFRGLFDRYAARLHRLGQRNGLSPAAAADLVQQTFLQLHRARMDFDRDRRFSPYLFTIALNLIRSGHRARGRRPELLFGPEDMPEPDTPARSGTERLERAETAARVRAALAALPEGQREVIELHWFQEQPFEDIAETLGASVSAVKVRAHRGYEVLRALLPREGQET